MKIAKACQQCRVAKRRCVCTANGQSCLACQSRRLKCPLAARVRTSRTRPLAESPGDADVTRSADNGDSFKLPPDSIVEELVELYLTKIHDRPHSLFHPPTLRQDVRGKRIGRALLCAICSMGCRFSPATDIRSLDLTLSAEAKRLLKADIENITLENIQTCILVAGLCAAESKPASEALFFRIANSMAQILGLPGQDPAQSTSSAIEGEVRRRIWWTLFMADRWCSSGLGLPQQMKDLDRAVDLPMEEAVFHSLTPGYHERLRSWKPGFWAYMVTLVQLFGPIQDLNQRIAAGDVGTDEVDRIVSSLAQQLQLWEEMLPQDVRLNTTNLVMHRARGVGGPFVALHLGFHHYSTLLYFQYLETPRNPLYASRCKHHAKSYSKLLEWARKEGGCGCEAVYPTVGHMATVSSSVLLHVLLFGEVNELAEARGGLNANFEALLELKQYWPSLTSMIDRLVTFQNMCLLSTDHTYQLDRWMVHFLIKHALPLEPKAIWPTTMSATNVPFMDPDILCLRTKELSDQGRFTNFTLAGLSASSDS